MNGSSIPCGVPSAIGDQVDAHLLHHSRKLRQETIANLTTLGSERRVRQPIRTETSASERVRGGDATELAQQQSYEIHNNSRPISLHAQFPLGIFLTDRGHARLRMRAGRASGSSVRRDSGILCIFL